MTPRTSVLIYNIKQSDGEALVGALGYAEYAFMAIAPKSTLALSSIAK